MTLAGQKLTNMIPARDRLDNLIKAHGVVFQKLQAFAKDKLATTKNPALIDALRFLDDAMRFQGVCLVEGNSCFKSPEALAKIHQQIDLASKYAQVFKDLEPRKNEASILDNLSPKLADLGSPVLESIVSAKKSSDSVKIKAAPVVSAANKVVASSPARAIIQQLDQKQIAAKKAGRSDIAAQIQIEKAKLAEAQIAQKIPPADKALQSLKREYLALIAKFTDIVAAIVSAPSVMQQMSAGLNIPHQAQHAGILAQQTHSKIKQLSEKMGQHLRTLKSIALNTLAQCQNQLKNASSAQSKSIAYACCNNTKLILQEIDRASAFLNSCCTAAAKQAQNSVHPSALVHPSKVSAAARQAAQAPSEIQKKFNQSSQTISLNLDSVQKNLEKARIENQKRQATIDAARGRTSQINRR